MKKESKKENSPLKPKSAFKNKEDKEEQNEKKKNVIWDAKNLQEHEIERKLHPAKMKIDEPKTPYNEYQGEDEYLNKITQVNKKEYSEDLMNKVIENIQNKKLNDPQNYIEVEIIDGDGNIKKELVTKDHVNTKEFLKKRQRAYANEFLEAKKLLSQQKLEEEEEEDDEKDKEEEESEEDEEHKKFEEQVITNTWYNKFVGQKSKNISNIENKDKKEKSNKEEDKKENKTVNSNKKRKLK